MGATLSIIGLNNYKPDADHLTDVWANFVVPDGINKDDLINLIMMECGELELLYPNWDFMKMMIGVWSRTELPVWKKLLATENFNYNPLQPFDITEEESGSVNEEESIDNNSLKSMTRDTERNGLNSGTSNTISESDSTGSVAAFNASALQPNSGLSETDNATRNDVEYEKEDASRSDVGSEVERENRNTLTTRGKISHSHGNMGSTSFQELIKEETANATNYIIGDAGIPI